MEDHIKDLELHEQEDGSLIVTMKVSEYLKTILIEKGFNAIIRDHLDFIDFTPTENE
jgi:hypothetical protein